MPIFWQRELVRPVKDWDGLSFADCERLLRGLYQCAGIVPAVMEPSAHARQEAIAWARAAGGSRRPMLSD